MQDSDSFICLYESDQCTRGEDEGVFNLKKKKKTVTKESGCIFDDFQCTDDHLESKSRI